MKKNLPITMVLLALVCVAAKRADSSGDTSAAPSDLPMQITGPLVALGADGKLVYQPYDSNGDTIPDFSNCGYEGGGVKIPTIEVKLSVDPDPSGNDDTRRLQKAIDQVSALPLDANGFRGALLLKRGKYGVAGTLNVKTSGVVLRGEDETDTTILATGTEVRPLIHISGKAREEFEESAAHTITDDYVPVGAHGFKVDHAGSFHVGDTVFVRRIGNAAWIHTLKMDQIPEKAGTKQWPAFNIDADRVITGIEGNNITVDAPITCAIDKKWGGGAVAVYSDTGRIQQDGVENIHLDSTFDPSVTSTEGAKTPYAADEKHCYSAVVFSDCKNCWGRHISTQHFVHASEQMTRTAKWVTVEDCRATDPVSIITGERRYPFEIQGQLDLFIRCYSKDQRHAFVNNGSHESGPGAFVDGISEQNYADSGPHQRWSTGTLWDNCVGTMHTQDRQNMGSGHGWAGANDVYWNCSGIITIQQPPTAENFAFGFVGDKEPPAFPKLHHADGYYESFGKHVEPRSLYLQQLKDRLGEEAVKNISAEAQ